MAAGDARTVLVLLPDESVRIYNGPDLSAADVLAGFPDCELQAFGGQGAGQLGRLPCAGLGGRGRRAELDELTDGMTYCLTPPTSRPGSGTLTPSNCSSPGGSENGRRCAPAHLARAIAEGRSLGARALSPRLQRCRASLDVSVAWRQLGRASGECLVGNSLAHNGDAAGSSVGSPWAQQSSPRRQSVELPRSRSSCEASDMGGEPIAPPRQSISRFAKGASAHEEAKAAAEWLKGRGAEPRSASLVFDKGVGMSELSRSRHGSSQRRKSAELPRDSNPAASQASLGLSPKFSWRLNRPGRNASLGRRRSVDTALCTPVPHATAGLDPWLASASSSNASSSSGSSASHGSNAHVPLPLPRSNSDRGIPDWLDDRPAQGPKRTLSVKLRYTPPGSSQDEQAVCPAWMEDRRAVSGRPKLGAAEMTSSGVAAPRSAFMRVGTPNRSQTQPALHLMPLAGHLKAVRSEQAHMITCHSSRTTLHRTSPQSTAPSSPECSDRVDLSWKSRMHSQLNGSLLGRRLRWPSRQRSSAAGL